MVELPLPDFRRRVRNCKGDKDGFTFGEEHPTKPLQPRLQRASSNKQRYTWMPTMMVWEMQYTSAEILWLFGVPIFVYSASIAESPLVDGCWKKTCWQLYRTKTTSSIISRTWQTYLIIMQCIKHVHWNFVSVAFSRIFRTKDISWRNLSTVTYNSLRRVVSTQSCSTAYSSPAPLPQHITPWVGSKHL